MSYPLGLYSLHATLDERPDSTDAEMAESLFLISEIPEGKLLT